jgi:hypothetical protein
MKNSYLKKAKKYEKPKIIKEIKEKEITPINNISFAGATSVYKTYIPLRKKLQL